MISNNIFSIIEDEAGIIWISTNSGISKYDSNRYKFTTYSNQPGNANSLINNSVWGFSEDKDGMIWIGTLGGGLDKFDPNTGEFTHFVADFADPNSINFNAIQRVYVDSDNVLWICSEISGGLDRMDIDTLKVTNYNFDANDSHSLSDGSVWDVLELKDKSFWVSTMGGGLNEMDRETGTFTKYIHNPDDTSSISDDFVTVLFEDSNNIFWVGTAFGLNKMNRETRDFTRYYHDPEDPKTISDNFILDIVETQKGELWFSTLNGIFKYIQEENSFVQYNVEDGLPSSTAATLLEDDSGMLWIGTYGGGLSKFDPVNVEFTVFSEDDGLQSDTFSMGHLKTSDGVMYFGGINGFNSFHPDEIISNNYIPPILITDFLLINSRVEVGEDSPLKKSLELSDEIQLKYTDNVFSIEFAALHYSSPESNQYAYMLEGFDEDWIYTSPEYRRVTYTNLDGGEYTFKVKGTNSHGVWNEEGTSIKIIITPPFWETIWFRSIAVALIAGAIIIGVRMRIRSSEQRRKELEILVDERTVELEEANIELKNAQDEIVNQERLAVLGRLAGNVSHELRNPLGVISNSIYFLQNSFQDLDETMKKYFDIISYESQISVKIITDLLNYGKDVESTAEEINISELINESLIKTPASADSDIDTKVEINPEDLSVMADLEHLEIVLKNLLDNAYQAMEDGGTLTISAQEDNEEVVIRVADTGEGISDEHFDRIFQPLFSTRIRGFGLGLSVVKKYVEANGAG